MTFHLLQLDYDNSATILLRAPVYESMSAGRGSFDFVKVSTVFGSPGSGKTAAVQAEFLAALQSGLKPSQILVLSATRESANSLRDSLALAMQGAAPSALARTISSFGFSIIRHRALAAGEHLPELISGSEQDRILAELISEHLEAGDLEMWPKHINSTVISLAGFRTELRDLITVCLEHGLSFEQLNELSVRYSKPVWSGAAQIYARYLEVVNGPQHRERYDPSQILREAAEVLGAQLWPQEVADIQLILVDDAQELTPAASNLIRVAASRGARLCLFGDPDASTLGFRSADPRAMSDLANLVASDNATAVETRFLGTGGHPSEIRAKLAKVAAQIETAQAGRQRKALFLPDSAASTLIEAQSDTSVEPVKPAVEAMVLVQPQAELAWLARRLRELHLYQEIPWSQMAVVARSQSNLQQLSAALSHEGVPVRLDTQSPLRDEFATRALLRVCWLVLNKPELTIYVAIEALPSPLCGLDALGLRRLRRALRRQELLADGPANSNELLVNLFSDQTLLDDLRGPEVRSARRFLITYFKALEMAKLPAVSVEDLLWLFWSESGLDKSWQALSRGVGEVAVQANKNLDAVVALFAAANRYVERHPGANAATFIEQQLALGLPEDTLAPNELNAEKVSLLTPAALISRTFTVVALPGLIEGVWPNLRPRSSLLGAAALDSLLAGRLDDPNAAQKSELPGELRMLYKAIGACYGHLLISATEAEETQVSQFVRLLVGEVPKTTNYAATPLSLRGIVGNLRRQLASLPVSAESERSQAALGLARLANAGIAGASPDSWYGLAPVSTIEPLVDLSNPDAQVFVRPSQLENFIKCPLHWFLNAHGGSDSTFSANLGSLLHEAFELASEVSDQAIWGLVESKWHTLEFESLWLEQAAERKAKRMISNLVQYLQGFQKEGGTVLGSEVDFAFDFGRAHVRGQVDRIEKLADGRVMIVDLKTGSKQFSAADAIHHAQLGVYQLAFEHSAFEGVPAESDFAGAKLLLVSGSKPTERAQPSLLENPALKVEFEQILNQATNGMAMANKVFLAEVGSHCYNSNEFGSCSIHLTKAVSFVG